MADWWDAYPKADAAPPGPDLAATADVPGQQQGTDAEVRARVEASRPAWQAAVPTVVGGNAPGYRQSDIFPIARRQDVIDNPNSRWSEGWAFAPGPLRALGQTPAENTTINPETGTMNIAPEALASASLLGGTPGLLFGGINRAYVPPGTLNRGPLPPEFMQNPLGPSLSERPMPAPGGPTSATGIPPREPTPEMHAVPPPDSSAPSPATGTAPKTAAEAKQVASQFYQLNAAQGDRQMPSDFINALSDDLNERGPKGPLETAVAGENRVGRIAAQVRELRDQPTTLEDAQRTYSRIGDEATAEFKQNGNSETYRDLMQIQSNMRDRIAPSDLTGNDAWTNARKAWSQAMKMDDLERIQQRAEMTDNPATSIKSGLRVLLSNPSRIRGYSPEEVQALRDASERGALGSVLHVFGSRLIPIVAASAEASSGGLTAGLAAAGAAHVGTTAIRAAAEALQTSRLNRALSTLAERVPRNQMMPPP